MSGFLRNHVTRVAAVAIIGVAGAWSASAAVAAAPRAQLSGTRPAWAVSGRRTSPASVTTGTVTARVYLAGANPSGLTAYATAVSTPGNPLYGDYLSAAQVQADFGPTEAQIAAVESWLEGAGLTVTEVQPEVGGYVAVSGSVAAASSAFGVTFGDFTGPEGKADRAPEQPASAPEPAAADVLTVAGLDTAKHFVKRGEALPPPGPNYWIAPPTSGFYGEKIAINEPSAYGHHQPYTNGGYTPQQIRGAYGVTASGMTGVGQTVAVVDAYASPTMLYDADRYALVTGDQPFRAGQYEQFLPKSFHAVGEEECEASGWYGEETLDVESVHGEAPNANVRFVAAASCEDTDLAASLAYIVTHHLASIVSNSYGEPAEDAAIQPVYDEIFKAGAAEGIGFFFSSGDNGYESPEEDGFSSKIQVDLPASSPWVTSVGGTSLAIGPQSNYEFETSWGTLLDPLAETGKSWLYTPPGEYPEYFDGASGGGVSTEYAQPFYQRGVVPRGLATQLPDGTVSPTPMRVEPDVSALADPSTGFLVGETTLQPNGTTYAFSLSRIGGTSVAAPTFAGIEADAQQAAGHPLGFANPAIYARYGTPAFHDVTDDPFGPGVRLAEVRNNYTNPYTREGPIVTYLRTLGVDGEGAAALPAVKGYDDSTGVGSPADYIQSFFSSWRP
jgi:subtilase family serine protease